MVASVSGREVAPARGGGLCVCDMSSQEFMLVSMFETFSQSTFVLTLDSHGLLKMYTTLRYIVQLSGTEPSSYQTSYTPASELHNSVGAG